LKSISVLIRDVGKMNWDDLHSEKSYGGWTAYGQSKLANILFTKVEFKLSLKIFYSGQELAKRLQGTGVTTNAGIEHFFLPLISYFQFTQEPWQLN
jgi:hypothetical protein